MIKNTTVKKIIKNTIFKLITGINSIIPKNDDVILLYMGNKGISFNNEALLNYLLENKYNEKYIIYCAVESREYFGDETDNVRYITQTQAIGRYLTTGHVFYTAGQLPIKPSKQQCVIHMQHGITNYKTLGALTKIDNGDEFYFTYMLATAPIYVPIQAIEYRCPESCITVCSEPMVDRLLFPRKKYKFDGFTHTILWAPTFRKSDYLGYSDSDCESMLPLFNDGEYFELNEHLKAIDALLIVKIHPGQTVSALIGKDYSNIRIYTNDRFNEEKLNLYDMMASVDALIGDYSSVSTQFLLTGKPLAYVIPDIEEYREKRGFVFDNPLDYMPGHIVYTTSDLWKFFDDFSKGIDVYSDERRKIRDIVHFYQDGKSCERLLELSSISL